MNTKHKIVLVVSLVAIITIAVCIFLIKRENKRSTSRSSVQTSSSVLVSSNVGSDKSSTSTPAPITSEKGAQKYANTKYGFEVDFPETWGGVEAQELDYEGVLKLINFNIKTTDPKYQDKGVATVIKIFVMDRSQFESKKIGTKLGEGGGYIFSYMGWEEPPSDHQAIAEKEIIEVLKTFKLTK